MVMANWEISIVKKCDSNLNIQIKFKGLITILSTSLAVNYYIAQLENVSICHIASIFA